jgi:hypothetical protein
MTNRKLVPVGALIAFCLLTSPGCSTNRQGDDASPVYLTAEFTLLPLEKNVASGTALQLQTVTLKSVLKAPGNGTSPFLDTQLDDYLVEWRRLDSGKAVPASEVFGGNLLVPSGGTTTLSNYPFMSASALGRPPLDQLFPFNGGVDRETGNTEMRMLAVVTFRGHTLAGQPVRGQGSFEMIFRFIGTTYLTREDGREPLRAPGRARGIASHE